MSDIEKLEKLIMHNKAMYYMGKPEIEDHEYDQLEEELKRLNPASFVLQAVEAVTLDGEKIKHDKKMLSLNKTYKMEELISWAKENNLASTYKIDGVSCSLIYENGKLVMAKTRGDGVWGENITPKVFWMNSVPKNIAIKENEKLIEVRGELFCIETDFYNLSKKMECMGLEKPTSQRNIVAGLISRKENLELNSYISFKAFEYINFENLIKTEVEKNRKLQELGFDVVEMVFHDDLEKFQKVIDDAMEFMSEGEYQIDGLVFTYNETSLHQGLGETAHHPRYKMAFKFKGESQTTKINKIIWSVSRNGILTPVGDIGPIELSGAKISRVTLHNYGMVKQNNLKVGDVIEIIRSGEVIPKFLKVIENSNNQFSIPETCPSCGQKIHIRDIRLVCLNEFCPERIRESILNFIKKIGIDDLSTRRLDEMLKSGLVKKVPDLYRLKRDDFLSLDKVKDKLAIKFEETIKKSMSIDLKTFLSSLGINGGAYNKCEKIVDAGFDTIEKVKDLTVEKLSQVESFAEKSSVEFINSLKEKRQIIDELIELGFSIEKVTKVKTILNGRKICITGALSEKRSVVEGWIRDAGGVVTGQVTKNTNYLLTNEMESNSSKYKKAKKFEVKIITENELKTMVFQK